MKWHSTFFETGLFASLVKAERPRILICGSADEETLSVVHSSLEKNRIEADIVVADACKFPLEVVEKYAKSNGVSVKLVNCDARDLPFEAGEFDAVVTDAFLEWFEEGEKEEVVGEWWRVLREGGVVLTSSRLKWEAQKHGVVVMLRTLIRRNPIRALRSVLNFNKERICYPLQDVEKARKLFGKFSGWVVNPSGKLNSYVYIIARK